MKVKVYILALLAALSALPAHARLKASEAFTSAPPDVFMLLGRNDRLDMVDYYLAGQQRPVDNMLDGRSRITAMTDEMMTIEMTPSSTYHLIILPAASESNDVIALVITLSTPSKDSRLQFYRADTWAPVAADKVFAEPSLTDWLTPEGRKNQAMVEGMVPFMLAEYYYDPATATLTLTNTLADFLSDDVYMMLTPYLRPTLTYAWTGKKLTLNK